MSKKKSEKNASDKPETYITPGLSMGISGLDSILEGGLPKNHIYYNGGRESLIVDSGDDG
jgi:hypothetical protein